MLRRLRFGLPFVLLAALLASSSAQAVRPTLPYSLTTTHFEIHYEGKPSASAITAQQAGDLAANLERAYSTITGTWGFPAPLNDGDGLIDVYVQALDGPLGLAYRDSNATQTSGHMWISTDAVAMGDTAAHELFHLIQFGMWSPTEAWLLEATAEWAGYRFLNFPAIVPGAEGKEGSPLTATLGKPDMSLSCAGTACGLDDYENGGYSRWHFFQWATERFGSTFVEEVFDKAIALNNPSLGGIDLVGAALAGRGSTITDAFHDWTVANLTGNYAAVGLRGVRPPAHGDPILTGAKSGTLPALTVAVNHLAARFIELKRGDGTGGPCYEATLSINVALPAGIGARPYFSWNGPGGTPIPLSVSGTNASVTVPWDTCTWDGASGLLSLPNPHTTRDAQEFRVTASIVIDRTRVATATAAPKGSYTGPTTPAPAVDGPPTIALYGPELIRVSAKRRLLRLVVFSSGVGTLDARLGTSTLGTRSLRTGNNDLRFTIPRTLLRTLTARGMLRLTSHAPSGEAGETLVRRVSITK